MKITDIEKQLIAILIILSFVGFFYVESIRQELKTNQLKEVTVEAYENSIKPFLKMNLNAEAFAIFDAEKNEFLYKKNAEKPLALASIAKVMSAIVVLENVPTDHVFQISKEALSQVGDSGLLLGERWGRDELLKFTLVDSSNDAVYELAKETGYFIDPTANNPVSVFVEAMNQKAKDLGYKNVVFYNPSGLDVTPEINGAYASARSVAKLFAYAVAMYPEIFNTTSRSEIVIKSFDKEHLAKNTNRVVQEMPGIIASKTGYTIVSGGNLVVATPDENGRMMIVVVLGSTFDNRFIDIKTLSAAVAEAIN